MRRLLVGLFSVALCTGSAIAATDVTGTWSGTFQANEFCGGGPGVPERPFQWSSPITLQLLQQQNAVTGNASLNVPQENNCQITGTFPLVIPFSGQISGNNFSGSVIVPGDHGPLSNSVNATISGDTMTLSVTGPPEPHQFTASATLTRTSSQPPESRLTGTYSGSFTETFFPCGKPPAFTDSGTLSGSIVQVGTGLIGSITATGGKNDHQNPDGTCTLVDSPPSTVLLTGQVSGNTIAGIVVDTDGKIHPFTATISGNTISGSSPGDLPGESFSFTLTRTSTGTPAPGILSFTANPSTINPGESSTLSWTTLDATAVNIDNGVGGQPASGSVTVKPTRTTTYTLTATGTGGTATATATVNVAGGVARIVVSAFPRGMVQVTGQGGGTDSFSITNIGSAAADVTLSPAGNFFTVSPTSFNLAAGATQAINVTGSAQPAGFFEGTVGVSGAGISVSIRLLSTTPTGENPQLAATVSRSDVSAPPGQNPSGSVSFTNRASRPLPSIAVSDVPWIIPQGGVITIQPGQTGTISFTIDSSKRPDASSPLGGVNGRVSCVFPTGSGKTALGGPAVGSVSVNVVYVVTPGVTPGAPPLLGANEVAFFVAGLANRPKAVGDLLIANKQSTGALSDLKLFFQGSGLSSQIASLPQIAGNAAVSLPGLLKNVFATSAQSGTVQIRGGDLSKVAVAAVQFNTSSPTGTFGTALPVLRSDRGIASGTQIIISGVLKQPGIQTDLFLQELTGNAATVQIEFLREDGSVISTRPADSLQPFGLLEIADAVPANATAVRIKNTSSGATKIGAYGVVTSPNRDVGSLVNDPVLNAQPTDDTLIIPLTSLGTGAQNFFFATNRTATSQSITVDVRSGARRRAVASASSGGSHLIANSVNTFTLRPFETLIGQTATSGFARVSSAPNAMSAVARSVTSNGGTGLLALPPSAGVGAGDLKRFPGVEDASQASRSTAAPGTFRTNLILIESVGQPATVRVTLRYSFVAGATVSATAVSSKEYSLPPSQYLLINDVARDVIGSARDSFGDLHNMELDVEVTGGSGRVLPFLQSIDNGSGDGVMRTE